MGESKTHLTDQELAIKQALSLSQRKMDESHISLERDLSTVQATQRSHQHQIGELRDWIKAVDQNVLNGFKEIRDDLSKMGRLSPVVIIGAFSVLMTILATCAGLLIFVVNAQIAPTHHKADQNAEELAEWGSMERESFERSVRLDERVKVIERSKPTNQTSVN